MPNVSTKIFLSCLIAVISSHANGLDNPTAPFMVQIKHKFGDFECGGSLVGPSHVLTSANCVVAIAPANLTVYGGVNSAVAREVDEIFKPLQYFEKIWLKDVAIIKLASPMEGENIETIALSTTAPTTGDVIEVPGWTVDYEIFVWVAKPKSVVKLPIISREECEKKYVNVFERISVSTMCAYEPEKDDLCYSPNGSPVLFNGLQSGIITWAETCGYGAYPALITNVAAVRDFIENSMKK